MLELTGARSLSHGELQPGRYVRLAVSDTGRGMDEATLARIFEPFFTTRSAGNGLGLATVREIVREHGGAMNVRSTPGEGSRFEVWLPGLATAGAALQLDAAAVPLGRGETMLMVANDSARLLRDEEMLAALGYEPVGFTDADGGAGRVPGQDRSGSMRWSSAISDRPVRRSNWRRRCIRLRPACRSCWRRNRPKKSAPIAW